MTSEQKISITEYISKDPKFKQRYDQTTISSEMVELFKKKFPEGGKIKIISASWCKDCIELVPKFGKIAELLPEWNVEMISRDTLSHEDRIEYNIQHIPTFIFYNKKDKEIGRIVEQPLTYSLEEDMVSFSKV
jgi:thiol-disulfide isomerase/thioredoxin